MAALRTSTSTGSAGRLERFTRSYPWLRVYALLPWLLPMTVTLVGNTGVTWLGWGPWLLYGVTLVVAFFAYRAVLRWYDRSFGVAWQKQAEGADSAVEVLLKFWFGDVILAAWVVLVLLLL